MKKKLSILLAVLGLIAFSATNVSASEGETTLRSVIGDNAECGAKSALMPDNKYTILITCENLVYPPSNDTNAYIVWASPSDGDAAIRLGSLGFGRAQFRTNEPFVNLFVSQERVNSQNLSSIRTPSTVVMRGNVDINPAAPPVFEQPVDIGDGSEVIASPTPAPRSNLLGRIGTGVVVTIISIIVIIVMLVIVKPFK